jgi:hypothetical protein
MTTDNDRYLKDLHGQLASMLDEFTPPAAPTATVKHRGKAIRTRRQVGVAAGVSVAVIAAVLIPGLLRQPNAPAPVSPPHRYPKVTVRDVGRGAPSGLIAHGTIDGKPWRITLSLQGKNLCVTTSGDLPQIGCGRANSYAASWPASLNASGGGTANSLYGIAAGQVSSVTVALSDGVVLNLRPVRFAGHKWIGLELPAKLTATKLVAYSRSGEIAYAIPFTAAGGTLPSVQAWLRPGAAEPRQFTRLIGSGVSAGKRWSVTDHVGPWGQCVVPDIPGDQGNSGCWTGHTWKAGAIMGTGDQNKSPWWVVATARPQASYLRLSMTDGTTRQVPVVQVGHARLYAIVIIRGPRIANWSAYTASGHRIDGGQGAPGFGRS